MNPRAVPRPSPVSYRQRSAELGRTSFRLLSPPHVPTLLLIHTRNLLAIPLIHPQRHLSEKDRKEATSISANLPKKRAESKSHNRPHPNESPSLVKMKRNAFQHGSLRPGCCPENWLTVYPLINWGGRHTLLHNFEWHNPGKKFPDFLIFYRSNRSDNFERYIRWKVIGTLPRGTKRLLAGKRRPYNWIPVFELFHTSYIDDNRPAFHYVLPDMKYVPFLITNGQPGTTITWWGSAALCRNKSHSRWQITVHVHKSYKMKIY